ncbi:MAG: FtsX-like permease family protein [Thermoplasmata archaeon]
MYPLNNLRRRSARTVLTIAGVSLAITLAIMMFSISEGIRESTDEIIEKSGIDILVMKKGGDIFFGTGGLDDGRELAENINSSNTEIKATFPILKKRLYISANKTGTGSEIPRVTSILATGSEREVSETFGVARVIRGDFLPTPGDPFFTDGINGEGPDSENFTHEILVNSPLAEDLDVDIGDGVYLSTTLPVSPENFEQWLENATWFTVDGILTQSFEDEGEMSATLHLSELQYVTGDLKDDKVNTIFVDLYDPQKSQVVKNWLENDFEESDKISALTQQDVREEIERFTSLFRGFSEMVAGITILVAFLFISTVIMISIKERAGELCALRALGFSRLSIFKLVLAESVLICFIGFIIGVILGALGAEVINIYAQDPSHGLPEGFVIAKITPILLLKATGSITVIGVLAGLIPAYWASRLNIIDGLKSE